MKAVSNPDFRLALPLVLFGLAGAVMAAPPEHSNGKSGQAATQVAASHAKTLVQNGRGDFQGNIKTGQHIYYEGDALDISVQFSRGGALLADGEADAHIVIFSFDGTLISVPVPDDIGTGSRNFFRIDDVDTATLPEGQYQLGLVLTIPDGDPTLLEDWYSGFRALLDTEAVYISDEILAGDHDKDGEWDDDSDDDGIAGEEDDEAEEDKDAT
jgi:hypothetical protein